jgi:hypothetical protein
MVGARSIARLRARSCTAALPAARALAVNRAPRSPPSFTPLRLARRAALTPLDPLATQHTLLFDRGDDHAVPPQPSLLSSKPQTATAASIANTAAKRPSSAAHAKLRQRNASRPTSINSRSLVIRCKTARTGNVRQDVERRERTRGSITSCPRSVALSVEMGQSGRRPIRQCH